MIRPITLATAALLLVALAAGLASAAAATAFAQTFDVAADPDFRDYRKVVTRYVSQRKAKRPGEPCVLGVLGEGGSKLAWVVWPGGRQIVLWESGETDLAMSRRRIRIPADVVKDERAVGGSTYLTTQAWVDDLTASCNEHGRKVRIPQPKN